MAVPMTLGATAEAMRDVTRKTVRRSSRLFLLQGVLLVLAGVLALMYPLMTNVALAVFLGWMLLLSGIFEAVTLMQEWTDFLAGSGPYLPEAYNLCPIQSEGP